MFDDQGVDVWHIHTSFNDGRGDQHIISPMQKVINDIFQLGFCHLTMRISDCGIRHELFDLRDGLFNVFHPVMQIKDLPAAFQLPFDGRANGATILFHDKGLDRIAVSRWCFDHG